MPDRQHAAEGLLGHVTEPQYRPVMHDPDLALFDQYDPDAEDPRPERYAGWDVANWCRVGVYEDTDGLHIAVSTRDKDYVRSVTDEQVQEFAHNLLALLRARRKYPREDLLEGGAA